MGKKSFKLGQEYRITFYDHFSTDSKTSEEATIRSETILTSWGRCVGMSPRYVILAYLWENDASENNDNMHILKNEITEVKKI